MEKFTLKELLKKKIVITENEKILLAEYVKQTNNLTFEDIENNAKNNLFFVIQECAEGDERAKVISEKIAKSISECDAHILNTTFVNLIIKYSSERPYLMSENRFIYESLSSITRSETVTIKLSRIVDEDMKDSLEITLILTNPENQ